MEINRRFSDNARAEMRAQIKNASGNEVFFSGLINESGVVVSVSVGARGSLNSVPVNFSQKRNCSVLIHNHPSGNLKPSPQDIKLTQDLIEASKVMQLSFLDHIILSCNKNSFFSMNDEGIVNF